MEDELEKEDFRREKFWSEAVAVGDRDWLNNVANQEKMTQFNIQPSEIGNFPYIHYLGLKS